MKRISTLITFFAIACLTTLAGCQWCCSCGQSKKKDQSSQESATVKPEDPKSTKESTPIVPKLNVEPKIIR